MLQELNSQQPMSQGLTTFILILFILVAILLGMVFHEIGHFVFAKIFKVSVKEFSIGIGPKIYSKKFKRTRFSFRPIPIMAYVLVDSKKLNQTYTEFYEETKKERNELLKIENKTNSVWNKIKKLEKEMAKYKELTYIGKDHLFIDDIPLWKKEIIYFGGIFFNLILFGVFYLIQYYGLKITINPFEQIGDSFLIMFKNMVFYNAWGSGPTNPGTAFGDIANIAGNGQMGFLSDPHTITQVLINYFCIFNLMLFIFNFIPIPPLDGFKIFFEGFESLFHIKVSKKVENVLTYIGISILFYMFATSIIADFIR